MRWHHLQNCTMLLIRVSLLSLDTSNSSGIRAILLYTQLNFNSEPTCIAHASQRRRKDDTFRCMCFMHLETDVLSAVQHFKETGRVHKLREALNNLRTTDATVHKQMLTNIMSKDDRVRAALATRAKRKRTKRRV